MSLRTLVLAALAAAWPTAPRGHQPDPAVLTVFAAASLTDAFEELGAAFRARHPDAAVRFNFAGSQQLALQLEHGASADVFASADQRWMAHVDSLGLAAHVPAIFAHNRLVMVVPKANPGRVGQLQDLARPRLKLVVAADAVPAGRYTREMLGRLSRQSGFPGGFLRRALANVVSEEENVKAVVAKVQLGEADAGVVYRSDVTPAVAPRLTVLDIPDPANVLASYPIVVLAGASEPALAREFVALSRGPEGRQVLERHGLVPAPADP
jgi:molybdate transport system substrate-binding protein